MKKYILTVLFVLLCTVLHAQISGTIKWEQDVDFSIQTESEYTEILISSMCYTEEVGSPKIPYCVKSFVLPNNAEVSTIRITSVSKRLIGENLLVIPAQYPIPVGEGHSSWVGPNKEVYNSSNPFPGQYAEIISDREDFGYHIVSVKFSPIEYIPLERKLYLCDLSFSLEYSMSRTNIHTSVPEKQSKRLSALDRDYVQSIVDNADMLDSFMQYTNKGLSSVEAVVPEYLIITNENLKNTFQVLANWKTKKGVPTIIETVENIVKKYRGADTQEIIRNYLTDIRSKYGSLFVLLGGDTNIIPARIKQSRDSDDKNLYVVDYYYTCAGEGTWHVNGDNMFVDNFGKDAFRLVFKLGRAPVENQAEAEVFVNKVINYERSIGIEDTRYYNNTLVVDAFIGNGECNPYLLDIQAKGPLVENYNKYNEYVSDAKSWFIYDDYLGTDSLRCMYKGSRIICYEDRENNKTLYDPVPGGTCIPGNEELSSINFLNALNNGGNSNYGHFHIIYHMDHSSPNSMGASSKMKNQSINKSDVDLLSNGNYNQIVMSGGCTPADITKDCVAEHFLNNPNGGAVAFIGNTDIGRSGEYTQFQRFCNELYKTSSSATKRYDLSILHTKASGSLSTGNCSLHLFGDPEMQVWTGIPQNLNVSVTPSSIQNGSATITVTINNLPNSQTAMVCLQKGDEVYTVRTMQNGTQSFTISPKTTGVVDVTITSHNFRPFEMTIPVGISPTAVLHVSDLTYDDDKTGESNGNNDKQLDAGEKIELSVTLKNEGGAVSGVATGSLTCNSPEISLINNVASFGKINAGASQVSNTKFVFAIDKDCQGHIENGRDSIEFVLTLTDGTNSVNEKFQIGVCAPEIEMGNQKVTWTSNGNTTIDAGETVKMDIDLMNVGNAKATGLKAVLISNNAQVSCSSAQIAYPVIPFAETKTNTVAFQFQTSASYTGTLNLTLQVSNEYGKTWNFPVNPLSRPAAINISMINSQAFSSSINVYWTSMGSKISYNIYRSDNGENGTYKKLNKFPLTATYYLDENLPGCTMFHYKVAAVSDNGNESEWSIAYQTWTSYPVVSPFPRRITTGTYSSESCPNIADVDNDGKQEIFWIYDSRWNDRTSYLMGFRPTGEELFDIDGNVTTVSGFAKSPIMMKGQAAFGDLAGNGEQNIVVSTWDNSYMDKNAVYCYSPFDKDGDHKPDLLWEKKIPYSMHQSPVIANLDGSSDGTMEVLIKSHQTSDIFILDHNGNELRRINPNVNDGRSCNYSALTVADLDNDGQMEIIASYDSLGIYIWRQDGTPFTTNPFWGTGILKLASAPVVCDLNGDGKKELIFSQHDVAVSHVYAVSMEGDKAVAGWNESQTIPYTDNGYSLDHTLSVGDINNDGYLEVVILGTGMVKAWKHTGEEIFSTPIDGLLPQIKWAANVNTPILADVDGDAIPDIVFCCNKYIYALHNDGTDIVGFPIMSDEEFQDTPCVADIDNDGRNEIVAGNEKDLYVWKTEGIPTAIEWGVKRGNPQNTGEYFPTVCKPMLINADETWDGESPCGNVVLQSGRLVIPSGKAMTLNNTSAVIVRSGATLEVDGGNILNARMVVQKGGTVVVKNNGLIKLRNNACLEIEEGATMDLPYGGIDIP
ncbi:MAG: C25 family cysteine peptidase [Bacteroides nordii]